MNTVAWERTVEESRIKEFYFYFSITSAKKLIKFISIKLFDRQLRFQFLRTATSKGIYDSRCIDKRNRRHNVNGKFREKRQGH